VSVFVLGTFFLIIRRKRERERKREECSISR